MSTVEGTDELVFVEQVALAVPIEDVMRELIPDLLGYFLNRLDDREDAADAVAETLLILWRKERAVPAAAEDARRYAFGVARKILHTTRRGRRRHTALADRLRVVVREEAIPGPEVDIELRTALGSLTDHDRELVLLVAWEGFSVADASQILGIRPDAARARYSRARARLREILGATP
ncbi:RNA polymerase sigma factor [Cryobacterium sp. Y82]|uniref:RNA polymerase sigma factor n=1 Tax=Cryobacterium sp. Y82 TaxID=2045017 RepID=UPI000CE3A9F2|nr:sigma-70 family RNA polymerase sigma factor [Cryobacterium sp. Y82]